MSYPNLKIENISEEFVQKFISKFRSFDDSKKMVNEAKKNKADFWRDHKTASQPEKKKFVRYAVPGTPLFYVLKKINNYLLRPFDSRLPFNIYGGRTGRSAVQAASYLIKGQGKNRFLLKTDLRRFFEQVDKERVFSFFKNKCGCSKDVANYFADVCTVNEGSKMTPEAASTLARGFSPSTRLATWCNIVFFYRLVSLVNVRFKHLKIKPRVVVYVDDIVIAVSDVTIKEMEILRDEIIALADHFGLELNLEKEKTKIFMPNDTQEILGILLNRRRLSLSKKSRDKMSRLKQQIRQCKDVAERGKMRQQLDGMYRHIDQIKRVNESHHK